MSKKKTSKAAAATTSQSPIPAGQVFEPVVGQHQPATIPMAPPPSIPHLAPGVTLPQGVTLQHPAPPFPPDLDRQLQAARRSGRYFIVVVGADDKGNLTCDSHRSDKFEPDWLLRAWQTVMQDIALGRLSAPPVPRPAA